MTNEIDWDNAPEGAEYFNKDEGNYYSINDGRVIYFDTESEIWESSIYSVDGLLNKKSTVKRPQPKPKYEYGVEYPTNGQKPDLPDDVLVEASDIAGNWAVLMVKVRRLDWSLIKSFRIVDERYKPAETAQEASKPQNPYQRTIIGLDGSKFVVDVYRVLDAFKTDSPALDHAIKKILCPGTRHAKTREQDLKEAIKSIEAELLLMSQR